jgi:hypothetical protein
MYAVIFWISDHTGLPSNKVADALDKNSCFVQISNIRSRAVGGNVRPSFLLTLFYLNGKTAGPKHRTTIVWCETTRIVVTVRLLHQQQESFVSMPSVTLGISLIEIDWRLFSRTDIGNLCRRPLWTRHTATYYSGCRSISYVLSFLNRKLLVWVNENISCRA